MTMPELKPDQSVVWTLKVVAGTPFSVQPDDGPVLTHDGVLSVWNIALKQRQAEQLKQIALHHGARVPVMHAQWDRTSGGLRNVLLDMDADSYEFRTPRCPGCFWFDPQTKSACGVLDWPEESKREVMSKAWDDLKLCPDTEVSNGAY